jgi:peptidoglycan/LPS O-acetylase OafA/YrhL
MLDARTISVGIPAAGDASRRVTSSGGPTREPDSASKPAERRNNFHLLRLVFALLVVAYHLVALSQVAAWSQLEGPLSYAAQTGVQGFFVLSGYLVFGSLERSASLARYVEKRIRRLYPAYGFVILAAAAAALVVSGAARADPASVARYVAWNLGFLNFMQPVLPGVFEDHRFAEVNGALWTLKIEVLFYAILPALAWLLGAAGRWRWVLILGIYAAAEVWRIGLSALGQAYGRPILAELARQLPGQMSLFITGVTFYLLRRQIDWRSLLAPAGLLLFLLSYLDWRLEPLRAAGLGILTMWIAIGIPALIDVAAAGDLSYGLYILHFPIVQSIVALGFFTRSPRQGAIIALGATVVAAECMWWLVERPALRRDSAYRRIS